MEKYLIIIIIIIIFYYKQKYCIQSEVDKILITKNIIEKFTDNINSTLSEVPNILNQTGSLDLSGGLNLLGSLIINNRHKLTSDGNYLKITDVSGLNFLNMSVKNLDVSSQLLVRQNSTFIRGPHSFNFLNIDTSGNNAGIKSLQGPLNIDASVNKIIFSGNTDISGNLTIGNTNRKPILIKTIDISNNINTYDTGISHTEYSGIAFSGSTISYASTFQFNTYQQNGRWFISITPAMIITTPLGVRVTFFHVNFVGDEGITFTLLQPTIVASDGPKSGQIILTMTAPSNAPLNTITCYEVLDLPQDAIAQSGLKNNIIIISGLNDTDHTFIVEATNGSFSSTAQSQQFRPTALDEPNVFARLVNPTASSDISLTWSEPTKVSTDKITTYTVTNITPSNPIVTYASSIKSKSLIVSNLSNNNSYTFNVKATNGLNSSIGTSNSIIPIAQTLAEADTKALQAINRIKVVPISITRLTIIDDLAQDQVESEKKKHTEKQETALTKAKTKILEARTIGEITSAQTTHTDELTTAQDQAYTNIETIQTTAQENANTQRQRKAEAVLRVEQKARRAINEIEAVQNDFVQNAVQSVKEIHTREQQTILRNAIDNLVVTQTIQQINSVELKHTEDLTIALDKAHAEILRIQRSAFQPLPLSEPDRTSINLRPNVVHYSSVVDYIPNPPYESSIETNNLITPIAQTTTEEQKLVQRRAQQDAIKKAQNETQQAIQDIQAARIYKTGNISINQSQETLIVKVKEIHSQQQTDILTKIIKAIQATDTIQAITDIQVIYTRQLIAVRTAANNEIVKVRKLAEQSASVSAAQAAAAQAAAEAAAAAAEAAWKREQAAREQAAREQAAREQAPLNLTTESLLKPFQEMERSLSGRQFTVTSSGHQDCIIL